MPNKAKGKSSAQYYKENPTSKAKKASYDKKNDARPERIARRKELVKINRKAGTYGNGDGLDASHKKGGKIVMEKASKNRGSKSNMPGDKKSRGGKNCVCKK
jgi:hypothetical protein